MSSRIEKGGGAFVSSFVKPLNDPVLGRGYMRVTTALPENNRRFTTAIEEILGHGEERPV